VEAAHQSERLRARGAGLAGPRSEDAADRDSGGDRRVERGGQAQHAQEELLALVEDEASKLSLLSTRLLQTAKLEADEMSVARDEIAVRDLVEVRAERAAGAHVGPSGRGCGSRFWP
jgi:hypothetical protein